MDRWSENEAAVWQKEHPWPLGINYVTSDAVNSVEMWMDSTFHPRLIEKELGIAHRIGFNSVRSFLPYIVWERERSVFEKNFETFLRIAGDAGLTVMPVLFDDCAFDFGSEPIYGRQPTPVKGVHNSRWVPCPGFSIQDDPERLRECRGYVEAVIGSHREDKRILVWDLYNEPGNTQRKDKCLPLLTAVFEWARALAPTQPLTAALWLFNDNDTVNRYQLENSDVISLHAYTPLDKTRALVKAYKQGKRPLLVTEWLHRPMGNTIQDHLPFFHDEQIGIWQWGMIVGRTQTNLSWKTMNGGVPEPDPIVWQHDLLFPDGSPYSQEEVDMIRQYANL